MRKAKIVDTIGPSTESPEGITKLVEAGMVVARLNRSHGTPEDHLKVYNNVRAASKATGRNVAAMVDLQGPKIRCGWFKKNAEGEDKDSGRGCGRRDPAHCMHAIRLCLLLGSYCLNKFGQLQVGQLGLHEKVTFATFLTCRSRYILKKILGKLLTFHGRHV